MEAGRVIVLNGTPRSGKTSIAKAIQASFEGAWVNLGVDVSMAMTPPRLLPGMGLRPGGERPDLEPFVASMYQAMYDAVRSFTKRGMGVVVDVGHHEAYSVRMNTLGEAARSLARLDAWLIGVRCPVEVVMERRAATGMVAPREMVERWEREVHRRGLYDLEVDSSVLSPEESAEAIRERMLLGPVVMGRLAREG